MNPIHGVGIRDGIGKCQLKSLQWHLPCTPVSRTCSPAHAEVCQQLAGSTHWLTAAAMSISTLRKAMSCLLILSFRMFSPMVMKCHLQAPHIGMHADSGGKSHLDGTSWTAGACQKRCLLANVGKKRIDFWKLWFGIKHFWAAQLVDGGKV